MNGHTIAWVIAIVVTVLWVQGRIYSDREARPAPRVTPSRWDVVSKVYLAVLLLVAGLFVGALMARC